MKRFDVIIEEYSSIIFYKPLTALGRKWIIEHTEHESWQWFGGSLAIDKRHAYDITQALTESTLAISRRSLSTK